MTTLAVTGATGTIGGLTARHLASAGHEGRLLVRDPSRAPDLGFPLWQCAYHEAAPLREALAGVDRRARHRVRRRRDDPRAAGPIARGRVAWGQDLASNP